MKPLSAYMSAERARHAALVEKAREVCHHYEDWMGDTTLERKIAALRALLAGEEARNE
jgi:hypothetical protein